MQEDKRPGRFHYARTGNGFLPSWFPAFLYRIPDTHKRSERRRRSDSRWVLGGATVVVCAWLVGLGQSRLAFHEDRREPWTIDREAFSQAAEGGSEEDDAPDSHQEAELPDLKQRDALGGPPFVACRAWAVADGQTGKLLSESHAADAVDTASTTKIMTAYVILRLAETEPEVLDDEIDFSERADKTAGSSSGLRAGEKIRVRAFLYGLLLPSGNDAAVALAEHFGPRFNPPPRKRGETDPVARFVAEMNRTASQLKLAETRYANPNGLPEKGHVSSARDLVRLTWAAGQLPHFAEYVGSRRHEAQVTGRDGTKRTIVWKTTNRLLAVAGYTGVKTGFTKAAGSCLVSTGERDGDSLIVVVLGAPSAAAAVADSRNLYRWAWRERGHKE